MSVRLSVCQPRLGGNVIFSAPNWDIAPIFFVQISLINENLYCKYFIRLSVGNARKVFATYGCCHPCLKAVWFSAFRKCQKRLKKLKGLCCPSRIFRYHGLCLLLVLSAPCLEDFLRSVEQRVGDDEVT